jgi:hypothetical protein
MNGRKGEHGLNEAARKTRYLCDLYSGPGSNVETHRRPFQPAVSDCLLVLGFCPHSNPVGLFTDSISKADLLKKSSKSRIGTVPPRSQGQSCISIPLVRETDLILDSLQSRYPSVVFPSPHSNPEHQAHLKRRRSFDLCLRHARAINLACHSNPCSDEEAFVLIPRDKDW